MHRQLIIVLCTSCLAIIATFHSSVHIQQCQQLTQILHSDSYKVATWLLLIVIMHVYVQTYSYVDSYIYIASQPCTVKYMCSYLCEHAYMHVATYIRSNACISYTCTHITVCMRTCMHTHILKRATLNTKVHTQLQLHIYIATYVAMACIFALQHACIHAYINTHILKVATLNDGTQLVTCINISVVLVPGYQNYKYFQYSDFNLVLVY